MLERLGLWFGGTLRRQLAVGMVLVVVLMMSLFAWDLIRRQQSSLLEHQSEHAAALAQSVAASSAVWVASRDFSGLQEIINGLGHDPDLQHAIVLDTRGQVLAHNDPSRIGLYLTDLPQQASLTFLGQDPAITDVASPIVLAGNHIGWVRIGLGQHSITERVEQITRNGVFYTLIGAVLAGMLATLAARRLTRRLYAIQSVADSIRSGNSALRAEVGGRDEAAQLANQFNDMLDTLANREAEAVMSRDALAQSESRLNQVMAVTGEGIWDWDLRSNRVRHNPSWCAMLGLDDGHLEHPVAAFAALLHEDDREAVMKRIEDCLAGKGKYRSEHRMLRADGQVIWVQDRGDVVERDANGNPLRMLGSITDITERIQALEALQHSERELKMLNETLEARVLARTAEVSASRDEAERANAAKSEFLSRMSHELRTPLNAILGFGQLLETDPDHPLTAEQLDNVHEILHAGGHLLELVNEVLDLARIESGRLDIRLEPVSFESLARTCLAQIQPLALQRGIKVALDLNGPCIVQADRTRIKQVLLNLLSNAVKYNREGGSIQVGCMPAGVQRMRISVRDTGRGIAADSLQRLFKPFERLETAYEGIEGTGIGLALSKKLVEAMDGEIGVESTPGEGSCFWFELPLAAGSAAVAEPAVAPAAPVEASDGRRKTLLCIEDNPANLRLVRKILASRQDVELLEAVNAEDGLEVAARHQPDLILLDINLPGMDGFEALRQLRDNPVTDGIPVIALTANAMMRDIERGKAAGFDGYLTKPIVIAELMNVVDSKMPAHEENQA